ncbi:hypothetical protein [Rufibacter soli]
MKTITLTDSEGAKITGRLPTGWHEVPLAAWVNYHTAIKGKPAGMEGILLVSCLTELPSEILSADVSLMLPIMEQMPWLGQLPDPSPLPFFSHEGRLYDHVGNLDRVDAGQFEALLSFLETAEGDPLSAAPMLLAVLYKEQGTVQDAATVAQAAETFAALPMSTAWGALSFFLTSSARHAAHIAMYSRHRSQALQTMRELETTLAGPSPTRSLRTARWLVRKFIRSARATLEKS